MKRVYIAAIAVILIAAAAVFIFMSLKDEGGIQYTVRANGGPDGQSTNRLVLTFEQPVVLSEGDVRASRGETNISDIGEPVKADDDGKVWTVACTADGYGYVNISVRRRGIDRSDRAVDVYPIHYTAVSNNRTGTDSNFIMLTFGRAPSSIDAKDFTISPGETSMGDRVIASVVSLVGSSNSLALEIADVTAEGYILLTCNAKGVDNRPKVVPVHSVNVPMGEAVYTDFAPSDSIQFTANNQANVTLSLVEKSIQGASDSNMLRIEIDGHGTGGVPSWTASDTAIVWKPETPIPAGSSVAVSYSLFAASDENPDKTQLTGSGVVVNGDYAGASNVSKFPSTPGSFGLDEWHRRENLSISGTNTLLAASDLTELHIRFVVNDADKQPTVWYLDNFTVSIQGGYTPPPSIWDMSLPSLKEAHDTDFLVGNIVDAGQILADSDGSMTEMYRKHYSAVTAENSMKPALIASSPNPSEWNFTGADTVVDWAIQNELYVVGHTLLWHDQSPAWLVGGAGLDGATPDRAAAYANLELYISTVASRYAGKVNSWDVANELFRNDGGSGGWRSALRGVSDGIGASQINWYRAYEDSADFIYDAYVLTRKYDPNAVLYYNDFNDDNPTKAQNIIAMVNELNLAWATDSDNNPQFGQYGSVKEYIEDGGRLLIEGIGLQSHYSTSTKASSVSARIGEYLSTGCELSITELDVTIGGWNQTELNNQAALYANLFDIYKNVSHSIARVTMWGKADSQSWRGSQYPLLFDGSYAAKPAFYAVIDPYGYLGRARPSK